MSDLVEEWRDIPFYEGYYQVSDWGRVRSLDRIVPGIDGRQFRLRGRLRRTTYPGRCSDVQLRCEGHVGHFSVAALVLTVFRRAPSKWEMAAHIDGNPSNNKLSNLEYRFKQDIFAEAIGPNKGEAHPKSRLTAEQVDAIKRDPRGVTVVAREYGVSKGAVNGIRRGDNWRCL